MQLPISFIELSKSVPPDVIAAILSLLSAVLGWLFGRKTKVSQD